jgi:hypothetical protein
MMNQPNPASLTQILLIISLIPVTGLWAQALPKFELADMHRSDRAMNPSHSFPTVSSGRAARSPSSLTSLSAGQQKRRCSPHLSPRAGGSVKRGRLPTRMGYGFRNNGTRTGTAAGEAEADESRDCGGSRR